MQKITPHLWFDKEAKAAAESYVKIFPDSKITSSSVVYDTPSGDCDILAFELCGQPFMAISAGPIFKINPSISFQVKCATKEETSQLWEALSEGGMALMPLQAYPFSEFYGWVQDKYGVSWQLMYMSGQQIEQKIVPVMTFVGGVYGKVEEAMSKYVEIFKQAPAAGAELPSRATVMMRYVAGEAPDTEGKVKYATFQLRGQEFGAMESAYDHKFSFNEAVSLLIPCENQTEIDYFWDKLSAVPEAEQCGWVKDVYGVSWQVWPTALGRMMNEGTPEQVAAVTKAFMTMKKFDIATLEKAYEAAT
jgi:predicted 3-demethylubiquinone-9 3-methyltransferase (glyoxalase superfamily)